MEERLERCAGLDVHKKTVVACIMIGFDKEMRKKVKTFGTMTEDLKDLKVLMLIRSPGRENLLFI